MDFWSDFFRAAFSGRFKESKEHRISLPDDEPTDFEVYVHFVYTGSLSGGKDNDHEIPWDHLCKLWILGDKYLAPALCNNVTNTMLAKYDFDNTIPADSLDFVFENTMSKAPLRKLILDLLVYKGASSLVTYHLHAKDHSRDVRAAILEVLLNRHRTGRRGMPYSNKCHYHIHARGDRC